MKLMLKHTWRPRPFTAFLGCMDLKTGVIIILLFALFNKVAGVYGLIAIFTGGSFAQVSMYVYSVATLLLFMWGLRAITVENAKETFWFAHMFVCDHIFSTLWLAYFSVEWWVYTEHNGQQTAHSAAQEELIKGATNIPVLTDDERVRMAQELWSKEKGSAAGILAIGWMLKIYFALTLYSFALHLRRGSYRSSARSQYGVLPQSATEGAFDIPERAEDFELEDPHYEPYQKSNRSRSRTPINGNGTGFANTTPEFPATSSNNRNNVAFEAPR